MEQKTIRILMMNDRDLERLRRGLRKNRASIGIAMLAIGIVELQVRFLRNNFYHHIQEYHRTEGD